MMRGNMFLSYQAQLQRGKPRGAGGPGSPAGGLWWWSHPRGMSSAPVQVCLGKGYRPGAWSGCRLGKLFNIKQTKGAMPAPQDPHFRAGRRGPSGSGLLLVESTREGPDGTEPVIKLLEGYILKPDELAKKMSKKPTGGRAWKETSDDEKWPYRIPDSKEWLECLRS